MKINLIHRTIAAMTLLCFAAQSAGSAPALAAVSGLNSTTLSETPIFPVRMEIPRKLGSVDFTTPGQGPLWVHIQESHESLKSQDQVRSILTYLKSHYGMRDVLVEGTSGSLHPETLRLYPGDMKRTMKIARRLQRDRWLAGTDLFLIQHPDARGYGIETLSSYLENGRTLRTILNQRGPIQETLSERDRQVQKIRERLNPKLREFLKRRTMAAQNHLPYSSWIPELRKAHQDAKGFDVADPREQLDWPMLARFFALQKMGAVDPAALGKETASFLAVIRFFFKTSNADKVFRQIGDVLQASPDEKSFQNSELLPVFEVLAAALPTNFPFRRYPNVMKRCAEHLLQSELRANRLQEELNTLETRIMEALAQNDQEKSDIKVLREYELTKKMLNLELSRIEWDEFKHQREEQSARSQELQGPMPYAPSAMLRSAEDFYSGAERRDEDLIQNTADYFKNQNVTKAVIVTGGFHRKAFESYCSENRLSCVGITPNLAGENLRDDQASKNYFDSILRSASKEASTFRNVSPSLTPKAYALHGQDPGAFAQALRQASAFDIRLKAAGKITARSEVRSRESRRARTQARVQAQTSKALRGVRRSWISWLTAGAVAIGGFVFWMSQHQKKSPLVTLDPVVMKEVTGPFHNPVSIYYADHGGPASLTVATNYFTQAMDQYLKTSPKNPGVIFVQELALIVPDVLQAFRSKGYSVNSLDELLTKYPKETWLVYQEGLRVTRAWVSDLLKYEKEFRATGSPENVRRILLEKALLGAATEKKLPLQFEIEEMSFESWVHEMRYELVPASPYRMLAVDAQGHLMPGSFQEAVKIMRTRLEGRIQRDREFAQKLGRVAEKYPGRLILSDRGAMHGPTLWDPAKRLFPQLQTESEFPQDWAVPLMQKIVRGEPIADFEWMRYMLFDTFLYERYRSNWSSADSELPGVNMSKPLLKAICEQFGTWTPQDEHVLMKWIEAVAASQKEVSRVETGAAAQILNFAAKFPGRYVTGRDGKQSYQLEHPDDFKRVQLQLQIDAQELAKLYDPILDAYLKLNLAPANLRQEIEAGRVRFHQQAAADLLRQFEGIVLPPPSPRAVEGDSPRHNAAGPATNLAGKQAQGVRLLDGQGQIPHQRSELRKQDYENFLKELRGTAMFQGDPKLHNQVIRDVHFDDLVPAVTKTEGIKYVIKRKQGGYARPTKVKIGRAKAAAPLTGYFSNEHSLPLSAGELTMSTDPHLYWRYHQPAYRGLLERMERPFVEPQAIHTSYDRIKALQVISEDDFQALSESLANYDRYADQYSYALSKLSDIGLPYEGGISNGQYGRDLAQEEVRKPLFYFGGMIRNLQAAQEILQKNNLADQFHLGERLEGLRHHPFLRTLAEYHFQHPVSDEEMPGSVYRFTKKLMEEFPRQTMIAGLLRSHFFWLSLFGKVDKVHKKLISEASWDTPPRRNEEDLDPKIIEADRALMSAYGDSRTRRLQLFEAAVKQLEPGMKERVEAFYELEKKLDGDKSLGALRQVIQRFEKPIHDLEFAMAGARMLKSGEYVIPEEGDEIGQIHLPGVWNPVAGTFQTMDKLDVDLDAQNNIFGITGANEIGKSTIMEAVAIAVLYHQMGLPIPAAAGAKLSIFRNIYTLTPKFQDDKKSKESQHLSFIKELQKTVERAQAGDLVILDEGHMGSEYADLVAATSVLLEDLKKKGVTILYATHLKDVLRVLQDFQSLNGVQAKHLTVAKDDRGRVRRVFEDGIARQSYAFQTFERAGFQREVMTWALDYYQKIAKRFGWEPFQIHIPTSEKPTVPKKKATAERRLHDLGWLDAFLLGADVEREVEEDSFRRPVARQEPEEDFFEHDESMLDDALEIYFPSKHFHFKDQRFNFLDEDLDEVKEGTPSKPKMSEVLPAWIAIGPEKLRGWQQRLFKRNSKLDETQNQDDLKAALEQTQRFIQNKLEVIKEIKDAKLIAEKDALEYEAHLRETLQDIANQVKKLDEPFSRARDRDFLCHGIANRIRDLYSTVINQPALHGIDQNLGLALSVIESNLKFPRMAESGEAFSIRNAVSPHFENAIPVDLVGENANPQFVVLGPHGSGKTELIRTLRLILMMHQKGLPVPADAVLPQSGEILTFLGAEEIPGQGQSYFRAVAERLEGILRRAKPGAIVLMDEIHGSDYWELSALQAAIIRKLDEIGCMVVLNTHMKEGLETVVGDLKHVRFLATRATRTPEGELVFSYGVDPIPAEKVSDVRSYGLETVRKFLTPEQYSRAVEIRSQLQKALGLNASASRSEMRQVKEGDRFGEGRKGKDTEQQGERGDLILPSSSVFIPIPPFHDSQVKLRSEVRSPGPELPEVLAKLHAIQTLGNKSGANAFVISAGQASNREFYRWGAPQPDVMILNLDQPTAIEPFLFQKLFFDVLLTPYGGRTLSEAVGEAFRNVKQLEAELALLSPISPANGNTEIVTRMRAAAQEKLIQARSIKEQVEKFARAQGFSDLLIPGAPLLSRRGTVVVSSEKEAEQVYEMILHFFVGGEGAERIREVLKTGGYFPNDPASLERVVQEFDRQRSFRFPGGLFSGKTDAQIRDDIKKIIEVRVLNRQQPKLELLKGEGEDQNKIRLEWTPEGLLVHENDHIFSLPREMLGAEPEPEIRWSAEQVNKVRWLADSTPNQGFSYLAAGSGDPTYASGGQDYTNFIFSFNGKFILIDPSPSTVANLQKHGLMDRVEAIYLSHVHGDHMAGTAQLVFQHLRGQATGLRKKIPLITAYPVYRDALALLGAMTEKIRSKDIQTGLSEVFILHEDLHPQVEDARETFHLEGELQGAVFTLKRTFGHPLKTFGFRFEAPGNVKLTYLADSMMPQETIEVPDPENPGKKIARPNLRYQEQVDFFGDTYHLIVENGTPGVHITPPQILKAFPGLVDLGVVFTVHSPFKQKEAALHRLEPFRIMKVETPEVRLRDRDWIREKLMSLQAQRDPAGSALSLTSEQMERLARSGRKVELQPGAVLFQEGDEVEKNPYIYIVIEGGLNAQLGNDRALERGPLQIAGERAIRHLLVDDELHQKAMNDLAAVAKVNKMITGGVDPLLVFVDVGGVERLGWAPETTEEKIRSVYASQAPEFIENFLRVFRTSKYSPRSKTIEAGTKGAILVRVDPD